MEKPLVSVHQQIADGEPVTGKVNFLLLVHDPDAEWRDVYSRVGVEGYKSFFAFVPHLFTKSEFDSVTVHVEAVKEQFHQSGVLVVLINMDRYGDCGQRWRDGGHMRVRSWVVYSLNGILHAGITSNIYAISRRLRQR